jgi:hypothetical protein
MAMAGKSSTIGRKMLQGHVAVAPPYIAGARLRSGFSGGLGIWEEIPRLAASHVSHAQV